MCSSRCLQGPLRGIELFSEASVVQVRYVIFTSAEILELSEASVVDEWLALQNLNHEVPGLHPVAW